VILCDVNVLIYAHKEGTDRHRDFHQWVTDVVNGDEPFGVSDQVLAGFLRIVTNRRVFERPSRLSEAFAFANALRDHPNAVPVQPGARHWDLFVRLCHDGKATGNLVPDAWFAALAIEAGCEWVTTDRDFARFPGLRWRHPLDG
jgi:toxin-antitoxin system PIN domain toxin